MDMPRRIHTFKCDKCAYNACQTDDTIATGDLLIILNNGNNVYALAGTWPTRIVGAEGTCMHEYVEDGYHRDREEFPATFTFAETLHQADIAPMMPVIRECICT